MNERMPGWRTCGLDAVEGFRRHAEVQPEAIAIEFGGGAISYAGLLRRVDSIVNRLSGCQGKVAFAIHGTPSVDFIAAMLAVWARNDVVLPVDSRLPPLRKSWMVNSGYVAMIIQTDRSALDFISSKPVWPLPEHAPPSCCPTIDFGADRQDACYIFYTSGSTGNPKPVLGRAASLDHFLRWQTGRFKFTDTDRICLTTSPSFDPFLRELLSTLSAGGTLLVPTPQDRQDPERIAAYLKRMTPTIIHVVPTLAGHWLRALEREAVILDSLRLSFFAGEALPASLVRAWRHTCPNSEIVNLYGPTETTLAKFYSVVGTECEPTPSLPVGKALPDTRAVIIGTDGRPLGAGEEGEVWIDTAFASYGYVDREVVKAPPSGAKSLHGETLHFTGDIGCFDVRGDLVIRGRSDNQIKIGGVKFNPAEVAQALKALEVVEDAFALGVDTGTRKELVAWYTPVAGPRPAEEMLRRRLRESLLPAMLPSRLVRVDRLPTNSNGKIDRVALVEALDVGPESGAVGDDTVELLVRLWGELLERQDVSADSNFFSLGGDSMTATRLCAAINVSLGRNCDVADVLDHPTPRQLGGLVRELPAVAKKSLQASAPTHRRTEVGISERQAAYQAVCMAAGDATWCLLSRSLRISGGVSVDAVRQALYDIARKHDALRIVFPHAPDLSRQRFLGRDELEREAISVEHHYHRAGDERRMSEAIVEMRARGSSTLLSLDRWPLFKAAVLESADDSVVILWVHHLAADGPSLNIIFEELRLLLALPALVPIADETTGTYQDYIESEREIPAPQVEAARAYWQGLLKDAVPLVLPEVDAPGSAEGRLYTRKFPETLRLQVSKFATDSAITPFVALLGGYLKAVAQRARRADVIAIVPMQARSEQRFEQTVGLFFTQAVLRLNADTIRQNQRGWSEVAVKQLAASRRHSCFEFHRRLVDSGIPYDSLNFPLTTILFNQNRLAPRMGFEAATPFGLHRLGRSLRFQLQCEVQVQDEDFVLSYLFRSGAFPDEEIAIFADEVEQCLEQITA